MCRTMGPGKLTETHIKISAGTKMKQVYLASLLIVFATSSSLAQTQKEATDQLQKSVAEAYKTKTMHTLDEQKFGQGSLLVQIVHSLMEGKGAIVRRRFQTF